MSMDRGVCYWRMVDWIPFGVVGTAMVRILTECSFLWLEVLQLQQWRLPPEGIRSVEWQ
jgi:hypothetical protein